MSRRLARLEARVTRLEVREKALGDALILAAEAGGHPEIADVIETARDEPVQSDQRPVLLAA